MAPDRFLDGLAAIRRELELPGEFPADALAEAERLPEVGGERVELDFVTIDPPGARDERGPVKHAAG